MDPERRRWLELLVVACEKVTAARPDEPRHAELVVDAPKLLCLIRAELAAGTP
jgi:hypothetical protein